MPYCTSCGAPLWDGAKFCTSCGARVGGSSDTYSAPNDAGGAANGSACDQKPFGDQGGLWDKFVSAINNKLDASSRVMDELERQKGRVRPGEFCHTSCLAEGECCALCVQRQESVRGKIDALRGIEEAEGIFNEVYPPAAETAPDDAEAQLAQPIKEDAQDASFTETEENAAYFDAALSACNEMLAMLTAARELSEAQKARITQAGGSWAMSLGRLAETPRGYKHYDPMTKQELSDAASYFKLPFSTYIESIPTGETCTWAAIQVEQRAVAIAVVGAGLLAATAAAGPGLAKTMEENRQRTKATNDQIHAARQRGFEIEQQAREKNRAGDRALHEQMLKQRDNMARTDVAMQNKDILHNDLRRAREKFSTERKYGQDVDRALKDYEDSMLKLHDD